MGRIRAEPRHGPTGKLEGRRGYEGGPPDTDDPSLAGLILDRREITRVGREDVHGLAVPLESGERSAVEAPLGSLPMQTSIDITWRAERLVALVWALGVAELPGLLEKTDGATIANTIGFLEERSGAVLATPRLRPIEELQLMNEVHLAVHWRLRRHQREVGSGAYDFAALVAKNVWAPVVAGRPELIDGDPGPASLHAPACSGRAMPATQPQVPDPRRIDYRARFCALRAGSRR